MADDDKPQKPPLPPGFGGKPPLPPGMGATPPTPPPLPGMGGGLPPLPLPGMGAMPGLPKPPSMPPMPGMGGGAPKPPALPGFPGMPSSLGGSGMAPLPPVGLKSPAMPAAPQSQAPEPPKDEKILLEKKLAELEKKLSEEREKLLVASIKRDEEAATAARVEVSIKELQEKLRRDRREQENEDHKLKLESKLHEMEQRLAQERETWVVTLRNQMGQRETQDKELETHFAMRVQEMERRWLEEKAQWQKIALAKDEEIRNLRSLAEKLKGADGELTKTAAEKKWLETRVHELTQERAEAVAKLQSAAEREKESIQLRADLQLARQQVTMVQDRLERDLQSLRLSAREREERLLGDQERLQRDLASAGERFRAEHEAELRRVKIEHEAEGAKTKEALERANADLQKLRGVAGALERQHAAARAQLAELQNARATWEKTQERYKAEFVVLQRKWVEREKEIRAEAELRAQQLFEAEKAKLKIVAQDELHQRVARAAEQIERDKHAELKRAEAGMRADLEREASERVNKLQADWDKARKEFEGEIERLHQELFKKESDWTQRLLAKETDASKSAAVSEEATAKLRAEVMARQQLERHKLETEKEAQESRDRAARLEGELQETRKRVEQLETLRLGLTQKTEELERLCSAQGAQVQNLQQLLDQTRGELAREVHLARLYAKQRDEGAGGAPGAPGLPEVK